jgi:hypothetical protein
LHGWLLRIVGALTAPHFRGAHAPVEEPSTASTPDILRHRSEPPLRAKSGSEQAQHSGHYSITSLARASMVG